MVVRSAYFGGNPNERSSRQVHPDVRKFTLGHRETPTTLEQLERQIMHPRVVATTCLSIDQYVSNCRAKTST